MTAMQYPADLIPIEAWLHRIDMNGLTASATHFSVVRRIAQSEERLRSEHPDWFEGYIPIDAEIADVDPLKLEDFSLNMVSDDSILENAQFRHGMNDDNGEKIENWDGTQISVNNYVNSVFKVAECCFLVFDNFDLHNHPFEAKRKYDNKDAYVKDLLYQLGIDSDDTDAITIIEEFGKEFIKNKDFQLNCSLRLRHDPTPLNYWHVVIEILAPGPNPLKNTKKAWREDVGRTVNTILRQSGRLSGEIHPLPVGCYLQENISKEEIISQKQSRAEEAAKLKPKEVDR